MTMPEPCFRVSPQTPGLQNGSSESMTFLMGHFLHFLAEVLRLGNSQFIVHQRKNLVSCSAMFPRSRNSRNRDKQPDDGSLAVAGPAT